MTMGIGWFARVSDEPDHFVCNFDGELIVCRIFRLLFPEIKMFVFCILLRRTPGRARVPS